MKKFFLAITFFVLLPITVLAQTPTMLAMARGELEKRGLEETEVRMRLLQEGIDVDNIPVSEYANYKDRVTAILNKMQAEKAAAKAAATEAAPAAPAVEAENIAKAVAAADIIPEAPLVKPEPTVSSTEVIATAASEADTPNDVPQTTAGEAAAEEALDETLKENHVSKTAGDDIYGHKLFTGTSMDVFRTTDGAQAPDTYVLGEGDEVHISIFGGSQTEVHQRIASDGSIQPAGSSKIFLKGLTLAQGRTAIINKLSMHYSFRPDQIAITLTTARTVTVSIYGEVGVQGGFTLSALNTAFNALAAAGGPTAIGSIRNIQRSRGGKIDRLDLYQYMTGNIKDVMFDLQNNDVLFVPVANSIVRVEGAVRRPMRYEMIEGESLKDLIEYAGGLTYNVYPEFIQIERRVNDEIKYMEYNLDQVMSGKIVVKLEGGDVVRIKSSNRPMENYVSIGGDVYYGGRFDVEQNSSLLGLIEKAQLKYTARKDYVIVERTSPDETVEFLTIPFPGENGNPDFQLQARDAVTVLAQDSYLEKWKISVNGEVRHPFTRTFGLNDQMTLGQAIEYAGGPSHSARTDVVYVERTRPDNTVEVLTLPFPNDSNSSANFQLQAKDVVRVLDQATFRDVESIAVQGDVRNPFTRTFGLNDHMTLGQALEYAGGPRYTARTDYVFVERTRPDQTVEIFTVPFPSEDNDAANFQLQAKDVVRVLSLSSFRDVDQISINGQVRAPFTRTFSLNDRMTVSQAIEYAHGLKPNVFPVAYIFRRDLANPAKMHYLRIDLDKDGETLLQPGDRLNIYDNTTYTNVGEVRVSGAVKNPMGTTFDPSITVHDLLLMAGGFEVGAAYDRVVVFRVNIDKRDEVKLEQITLHVDENYNIIEDKKTKGFQLQPYDHIVVRMTPNFTKGRVVEVHGRVRYPGTYVLEDSKTQLWEIIKMAGGLLDDADPFCRLMRTSGRYPANIGLDLRRVKRHRGNIKDDPILMDGDVITITRRENTVVIRETGTRMAQYVPADFSSTQKVMVYKGRHSASWYVRHMAGGFDKYADRKSVTVTYPNNQSEGTHSFMGFRRTPLVEPGGVITMRMNYEKKQKDEEPKKEFDWGKEASNMMSALTSIMSIVILVNAMKNINNN